MADRDGPSREEIEAQAVRRLIALGNDPSPSAMADLTEWIARDPAHAVAFARAELAWEQAARLKSGAAGEAPRPRRDAPRGSGPAPARIVGRSIGGSDQ